MIDALIKYRRVRTVSQVLNTAVNYMLSNFGSMLKCMLFYVMPFFLASTLASYYFNSHNVSVTTLINMISNIKQNNPVEFISILVFYFFAITLQNQVLNKHLILNEESAEGKAVDVKDLKPVVVEDFRQHLPNVFFLTLTVILTGFILGATLGGVLEQGINFNFDDDPYTFLIQVVTLILLVGIIFPLSCYFISTALFISLRDKMGIFQALAKAWAYAKEKLFITWATSVIAIMIAYLIQLIFQFPMFLIGYLFAFFRTDLDSLSFAIIIFSNILTTFFGLFSVGTFQLMVIFHFTSLEEQKEGINILNKINTI